MALRAVIFDYGMVLTGPPDARAHGELMRITGLSADRLDALYWADRHAFDEGKLSGRAYWQGLVEKAGLALSSAEIEELMRWDARMWMSVSARMLGWAGTLKAQGMRTAILSNMGDSVLDGMEREFDWFGQFDVLVWSYQLRMAKPDPAIYRYALDRLGAEPAEALFFDDKQVNVDAALALGIKALVFTSAEKLRADLIAAGLDGELPLPE